MFEEGLTRAEEAALQDEPWARVLASSYLLARDCYTDEFGGVLIEGTSLPAED